TALISPMPRRMGRLPNRPGAAELGAGREPNLSGTLGRDWCCPSTQQPQVNQLGSPRSRLESVEFTRVSRSKRHRHRSATVSACDHLCCRAMKLLLLGATGGTGRQLVSQALEA